VRQLPSALIVEDGPALHLPLAEELEAIFNIVAVRSADEALDVLEKRNDVSVVISDVEIPGSMDGIELAHYIRKRWPRTELVVTSCRNVSKSDLPTGAAFISKSRQTNEFSTLLKDLRERFADFRRPPEDSSFPQLASQFYATTSACFRQEKNTWTLVTDTASGAQSVNHQWSYVDPFGHGQTATGSTSVSVESFLMGNADDNVKQRLREFLLLNCSRE
jgi:CheY-like chemotaxis protein